MNEYILFRINSSRKNNCRKLKMSYGIRYIRLFEKLFINKAVFVGKMRRNLSTEEFRLLNGEMLKNQELVVMLEVMSRIMPDIFGSMRISSSIFRMELRAVVWLRPSSWPMSLRERFVSCRMRYMAI